MTDLWTMLRDAQAAQAEMLAEQQRVIDALPREYRVPPPNACPCFEGQCRGVEAIPFGLVCKARC